MEAIRIQQTIIKKGELILKNLPIPKGQEVEVLLLFPPSIRPSRMTAKDLLNSEILGLWKNRTDINDSLAFARQLREKAQKREGINYADFR